MGNKKLEEEREEIKIEKWKSCV